MVWIRLLVIQTKPNQSNQLNQIHKANTNKSDIDNNPFSTQSTLENSDNSMFSLDGLDDILNGNLLLRFIIHYLLYTLTIFILSVLITNNKW